MPYIKTKIREELAEPDNQPMNAGELNYVIHKIVLAYIKEKGGVSYSVMNEVAGVLACVQQELYRRITGPYEDQKVMECGDLPEFNQLREQWCRPKR